MHVEPKPVSTGSIHMSRFRRYALEVRAFTAHAIESGGMPHSGIDIARGHLDGRAGRELRATVDIKHLRELGAFFTGEDLAAHAVGALSADALTGTVVDPACGCGDLLLAVAARLPVRETLQATLGAWGRVLRGADVERDFVEVARTRLALLALLRGARPAPGPVVLEDLLPGIVQTDGFTWNELGRAGAVLLNPPYGMVVAPRETSWSSGRTTAAALWTMQIANSAPPGAEVIAILPDVLRSGSRYAAWRETLLNTVCVRGATTYGQFDALTDVDVFVLRAVVALDASSTRAWPQAHTSTLQTLADRCAVWTGPVVDRRDPEVGPEVPYLTTRELPQRGTHTVNQTRRFSRRLFRPPFVVVRRTSRPTGLETRLRPVLVKGRDPVAVENHLLVLIPDRQTLTACRKLAVALQRPEVTAWLDERIRCRHLTVTSIREIPLALLEPDPART